MMPKLPKGMRPSHIHIVDDLDIFSRSKFTFSILFLILLQFICLGMGFLLPIFIGTASALVSSLLFAGFITSASTTALAIIYVFFAVAQGFTVGNIMTNGLGSLSPQLKADGVLRLPGRSYEEAGFKIV